MGVEFESSTKFANSFDPEVEDSLRPNGRRDADLREWEKSVLMHLNNINLEVFGWTRPLIRSGTYHDRTPESCSKFWD